MHLSKSKIDQISYDVMGACIEVHKALGSGLLESVYHICLKEELASRNIQFESEIKIPIHYKEKILEADLRCDFFIENCIVLEIKSVQEWNKIFEAQVLTYMRLLDAPKGLLVNFFCSNIFHNGQKSFVNNLYHLLPDE